MYKILIVEDESDTAKVLVKRLTSSGYSVAVASDGYQGVEFARTQKPDLMILDLMLPAGGGVSVLQKVRLSAAGKLIPVVVLTGMKDEMYKKQILQEGVDAYLEKPYEPEVLLKTLERLLQGKK